MTRIFVLDNTEIPALFGKTASYYANDNKLPLWSLTPCFDGHFADSHQHVCAAGYCVTSGLHCSDTLEHEVATADELLNSPMNSVIVLSAKDAHLVEHISGIRFTSDISEQCLRLKNELDQCLYNFVPDTYDLCRYIRTLNITQNQRLTIGVIGKKSDHQYAYPAVISALCDAAEALSIDISIHFLAPSELSTHLSEIDVFDGIVLPGGSSMAAVKGQIQVAQATLARKIPTLGLCLGMQSMATAIVRQHPGYETAILEEVSPDANIHSFSVFPDHRHRCGIEPIEPISPLNTLMSSGVMHYNHRYRFSPELVPLLNTYEVVVSAQTEDTVEAISHLNHPFWHGLQGHPELASRADGPHPLFVSYLKTLLNLTK